MNDTVGNGSEKPDLYAAIGGAPTVEAVVDELYRRLSGDPFVQHHFQPERLATLKAAQREWFTEALSGAKELPKDLASAHSGLKISDEEVAAVLGHLEDILNGAPLSPRIRRAVLALVSRLWYARQF